MTKYTTGNPAAQRKMGVVNKTEPLGTPRDQSSGIGGQHTDPAVRLGPLTGPAAHGEVAIETTMRKPQAYRK